MKLYQFCAYSAPINMFHSFKESIISIYTPDKDSICKFNTSVTCYFKSMVESVSEKGCRWI